MRQREGRQRSPAKAPFAHPKHDEKEDEAPEEEDEALAHGLVAIDLVHDLQGLTDGKPLRIPP